jgi:hypothetical protein
LLSRFLKAFCCIFLVTVALRAEEKFVPPDQDTSLQHFPTKILHDVSNLLIPQNITPFAVGSLATALDWTTLDGQNNLASSLDQWNTEPLFDFGNFYGEGWVEGGAALGSWSLGALTEDLKLQQFGRDSAESLVMATVLVTGLKYAVNRTRPNGGSLSFPSGHAITAFCVAPVVQKYWGWEAGVPAYLLATITGFARVEDYYHYFSDVIAGATLGIVIGNAVVYTPKDVSVSVEPGTMNLKLIFD